MLNLIIFGPPGSGKGTQAQNIIQRYQVMHISTGDLLREEVSKKSPLGIKAKELMDQGALVPDDVVVGMINSKIDGNKNVKGFVFDGFPRTVAQAEALDKLLDEKGHPISLVLSLVVSEEELVKRILLRGQTSERSDDKNESIIRNRIEEYKSKTAPVAEYYKQLDKLKQIPGEGSIDDTFILLSYQIDKLV